MPRVSLCEQAYELFINEIDLYKPANEVEN